MDYLKSLNTFYFHAPFMNISFQLVFDWGEVKNIQIEPFKYYIKTFIVKPEVKQRLRWIASDTMCGS